MLALHEVRGLSDDDRLGYSAAFLSAGGVCLIFGTHSLFFEDAIEVGWRTRQASRPSSGSSFGPAHFAFVPVHGGGALGLSATF